ncbi:unnamed protein product [Arctia plantaginis]|uniref:Uncharacterized protein n=1 Tax=Arctia plantaginis TaxID=874455 RepID=A0A8S0ZJ79_ARCPL|nr:unnamed protein product [Arctia plantaginis]
MDPSKMKVVDLRSELGALGLDTKGNKPALVERLKKALEAKTGKALPDTSILDTSTEDADEPATPRRVPAARTTRRSSSSRLAATPAKPLQAVREEPPEAIEEENRGSEQYSPSQEDSDSETPAKNSEPEISQPEPPAEVQKPVEEPVIKEDEKNSPVKANLASKESEPMETQEAPETVEDENAKVKSDDKEEMDQNVETKADEEEEYENDEDRDDEEDAEEKKKRELTEEEEWKDLNERLKVREQERLELERKQAEEDAKRLEEVSKDPVKLNRLRRKQQKKARWSNFYRAVEVTNELLALPEEPVKDKRETTDVKIAEPEIDENKITLSWYDSDLNQYVEVPALSGVVAQSDGAFAHAWAGARATHAVAAGRVCYEVRVGAVVTTTEITEKEPIGSGLRIGWSTTDSSLHLGDGEMSFGYESSGRAVHNSEFKEYGKTFTENDVVGAYLDLESSPCKMSYTLNGLELGVAHEFDKDALGDKALFPHILTKNTCYKVNFGYDKYNMLTKTKLVRTRLEIPVEQVLEERRRIEEEQQKQKEEAARKERERRDKEKKEREERQRKKKEERERVEREKKEKEDQAKKEKDEEEPMETEAGEKDKEKEKEPEKPDEENEKVEEPKENGEKVEESDEKEKDEAKPEPMEAEPSEAKTETEIKEEPDEAVEITEEQVLKGQVVLDKKIKFVIRYLVEEELDGTEACLVPGYVLISNADLVEGPTRPASIADCEVILMVGLPGAGKTHWVRQHVAAHPERRYNVLSTAALIDRMKVDCKPFRATYEGRWDAMVSKCAKCVLKLLEIAKGRRRNFILDQTNVYPSAQRRKLREFDGYRRVAVAIVTDDETYRDRHKRREEADGKEVPDPAIVDMKANFMLPEKCSWVDEVVFPELGAEAARAVLADYHREARAAGVTRDKDKRERSASQDLPPAKRHRSNDKGRHPPNDRRPRDFQRDREDRWGGGGGGGSRWGGGGGGRGGSRWGPREPRGPPMGGPNQSRFDRPWQSHGPPPPPRGDFGRGDRDNFRGGRGGQRPDRGGRGGGPPPNDRFGRDRPPRPNDRPDKRPHQPGGGNNGGGGGGGGWQRGAGPAPGAGPRHPLQRPALPHAQQRPNPKDGPNQNQNSNQQNPQGWNQWTGGWGGWGPNWGNQGQGWQNWGNWGNWNNPNQGGNQAQGQAQGGQGQGGKGQVQGQQQQQQQQQGQQQQWPANYTAQQWYQWQQWQQQQQQQGWPGYQQGNQPGTQQEQAQAWAQYYQMQNYAGNANAGANNAVTGGDKK